MLKCINKQHVYRTDVINGYLFTYKETQYSFEGVFKSYDELNSIIFCLNNDYRDKLFQWKFKCTKPYRVKYMFTDGKEVRYDPSDFDYTDLTIQLINIYNSDFDLHECIDEIIYLTNKFINSYFYERV